MLEGSDRMAFLQISMMLNMGSLILGVGAWVLAIFAIITPKPAKSHRNTMFSFCFCVLSLISQLFEINNRVSIGDYSTIDDTIGAVLIAAVVLIVITIALNTMALIEAEKK